MKLSGERNQCPTCGLYFLTNKAFEAHRTGNFDKGTRRCLTEDEIRNIPMRQVNGCPSTTSIGEVVLQDLRQA